MRRAIENALQPRELTRAELYEEARALGIEGLERRSKMNKGALKAAVARRQRELMAPRV
jgi:hypothetical protein